MRLLPGLVLAAILGAGLLLGAVVGVIAAYALLLRGRAGAEDLKCHGHVGVGHAACRGRAR